MKLETQIIRTTVQTLPESVFTRLVKNQEFLSITDSGGGHYPDLGSFRHDAVLTALHELFDENKSASLSNMEGKEFYIDRTEDGIRLTASEGGNKGRYVPEFGFLVPAEDVRLHSLEKIISECQPILPSSDHWRSILEQRPLKEHEISHLVTDIRNAPSRVFSEINRKWKSGSVDAGDLFPSSLTYCEALVGPRPRGENASEYIQEVLVPYHRQILSENFESGLGYILPISIDPLISPSSQIADCSANETLSALSKLKFTSGPYALFSVLEISLSRITEEEGFRDLAAETIERLVAPKLLCNGDIDAYALMPMLVQKSLNWISVAEWGWDAPPYWKRLVAFSHAQFILDILTSQSLDVDSLHAWGNGLEAPEMISAELLDLQKEPMWRSDFQSSYSIRAGILGRVLTLANAAKKTGLDVPSWDKIIAALDELKDQGALALTAYPGPLGREPRMRHVVNAETTDSENTVAAYQAVISQLEDAPLGTAWTGLSRTARLLIFDEGLLSDLEDTLLRIEFSDDEEKRISFFEVLANAASISSTQPCEKLADAVANCILKEARNFSSSQDAEIGYRLLFMASAALEDKNEALDWLKQKITEYAFSIPKGEPCIQLFSSLEALKKVLPIRDWHFGKAQKTAAASIC